MDQYSLNTAEYGTHRLIACEIGSRNLVLDVGCSRGYLKQLAPNNTFYGIDYDYEDIKKAEKNGYKEVYHLDLNDYSRFRCKEKFDVIVFADILEHLLFPDRVLKYFVKIYLKEKGRVIISLPNVAHFSVRLPLLLGKFDYRESGILDKSHLHLYTLKTARVLISSCGLKIIKEKFSSNNFGRIIRFAPILGSLLGYNLIFICKK